MFRRDSKEDLGKGELRVDTNRIYWNEELEPILNTDKMSQIQLAKVQSLIKRLYEAKPYWRQRFDSAGVVPSDIRSLADFGTRIPVMEKADRRQLLVDCDMDMMKAMEMTIGVPMDEIRLVSATSGTSGEPTPLPQTHHDIAWLSELYARMLWRMGIRPGSRIVHAFGLSMFQAGVPFVTYFQRVGASVFPVGAESGADRVLRFLKLAKADTLACTPSLAEHLIDRAPTLIGQEIGGLGVKRLLLAGEPGAGIPEVRAKLETSYGARVFDHGGSWGVSCEWPEYQGMHYVSDDKMLFELVDPTTKESIPLEQGARGMPVHTTLEGEGFLFVRESLGDIAEVSTEPCPCGRSGFRYRIVGRVDDMLKVKGAIVYPAAIDGVITSFAPRVTGEFRIVLDEPPPRVVPPLKLKIEYGIATQVEDLETLGVEIEEALHAQLKFRPRIIWLPPHTLERSTYKTQMIDHAY